MTVNMSKNHQQKALFALHQQKDHVIKVQTLFFLLKVNMYSPKVQKVCNWLSKWRWLSQLANYLHYKGYKGYLSWKKQRIWSSWWSLASWVGSISNICFAWYTLLVYTSTQSGYMCILSSIIFDSRVGVIRRWKNISTSTVVSCWLIPLIPLSKH